MTSPPRRRLRGALANLALLAATLLVLGLAVELTLRLSGFSFVLYPETIEFGKPDPVLLETGFLADDDLFWVEKGYFRELEALRRARPSLVLLGDSCTALGHYDEELARRVAERRGVELRYGNLAVPGWSSYQGRRQLERDVAALEPEVVTIYFGWNDHWIGFGIEDKNVARVRRIFSSRWSELRVVQLVTKAVLATAARGGGYPNRVSLADFESNLRAMVETARAAGAVPVLLTAPTSHRRGEEPAHLATRWLRDLAELVPLHQAYVDAVRRVAASEEAPLCDLAAAFAELPRAELEQAMMADGIHLTPAGDRLVARELYGCLEREGLLDALTPRDG